MSGGLLLCAGSSACCAVSTAELTQSFFGMLQVSRCTYALFFLGCCKVFSLCERVLNRTASKRFRTTAKFQFRCACVLFSRAATKFLVLAMSVQFSRTAGYKVSRVACAYLSRTVAKLIVVWACS